MRRWNGWGDASVEASLSDRARDILATLIGRGTPPVDAALDEVVAVVPEPRVPAADSWSTDAEDRVRHAHGQSLPDWIALRSGRFDAVPDAVARPGDTAAVRALLDAAGTQDLRIVPYGGGTSVVGGVSTPVDPRPVVAIDLERLSGLRTIDLRSGLATFGAGTTGPAVEASLAPHDLTLGHFPQSFEFSTVGGWVAARSVGQESAGYGRIERLFAGGRLEAPAGTLEMPPHPSSAAGPDLRELVLGSEGRLGILTDAVVRVSPRPAREIVRAYSVPGWEPALEVARDLGRSRLPLSMVRVSTPLETVSTFAMSTDERAIRWLRRYLGWRGHGPDACLVIVMIAGAPSVVRAVEGEVAGIVRARRGVGLPGVGAAWRRERFASPYLRNTLWEAGYAVDTLETATTWSDVPDLAAALGPVLRHGLEADGERVHAFSHLSHLYPTGSSLYTTYIFRIAADPDETLDRWRRLKTAASETIVAHGATISHQHGVGRDHARYLRAEKGELGMTALAQVVRVFDPAGIMSPGVLLERA